MLRLARIAGSFAIVLVAYWLYAHTAVPLIEPSVKKINIDDDTDKEKLKIPPGSSKDLQKLFRSGDWEIDPQKTPKILEVNNRAKILFQKYEMLNEVTMKLSPCTIVFLYDGHDPNETEEDRLRQSIVLKDPDGAIIHFDAPINSSQMKIGRPIGGQLLGSITIFSEGKSPEPEDDLRIHARDIVWSGQEASSDHPLDFLWGKNLGVGSGMHIKFTPRDPGAAGFDNGPNISGIEIFEMRKIDKLHIEGNPNKPALAMASNAVPGDPAAGQNPLASATASGPIDINCRGPFLFNMLKRVASFEDHVEVRQQNPTGPANQLLGDKLLLYFVPRSKDPAVAEANSADLEPERIEALGKPVTLSAPGTSSNKSLYAEGEHLIYNLKQNLVELDGGPEVTLKHGESKIHGKSLKYLQNPANPKAIGKAWVKGPGRLYGTMDDRPGEHLEAHWNGELNLSPKDGYQVISLTGGALLDYTGLGKLSAESIYFWFSEHPQADPAKAMQIKPVKMLAKTNVTMEMVAKSNDASPSTQFSGAVDEMKVWFEQKDMPGGIRMERTGGTAKTEDGSRKSEEGPRSAMPVRGISYENSTNIPTDTRIASRYLAQQTQLQPRTVFRQPILQPQPQTRQPPATLAAPGPAAVRPVNAAPGNPNPLLNANRGMVSNPHVLGVGSSNNLPLPQGYNQAHSQGNGLVEGGGTAIPVVRQQRFAIRGGTLEAKVLIDDPLTKPELSNLIITGNVRLEETQTREPGEKPLVISGDKVVAEKLESAGTPSFPNQPQQGYPSTRLSFPPTDPRAKDLAEYKITVLGQPALVEGHGLTLSSTNINLDQRANRLWIEGPGSMDLPMPDHFNGQPIPNPGAMNVKWKQGMNFDGRIATFEEAVDANSPGKHLQTQTLKVTLTQPIKFSDPDLQNQKQDPAFLSCYGGVFLETNELDKKQQRVYIRMEVADLDFDLISGALTAGGPGWMNMVRPDDNSMMQTERGIFLPIRAAAPPDGNVVSPVVQPLPSYPLMGMHIKFRGAITGNLSSGNQQIDFNEDVRVDYAPVNDWAVILNPDKTELPSPNEFLLKCDNLKIRNAGDPVSGTNATEMDALGSSSVYGMLSNAREKNVLYTGRAMRISYTSAKDILILQGNGSTDALLSRQPQLGGPRDDMAAKTIRFNLKTRAADVDAIQSIHINRLAPAGK
jgi:lipopolysaccharide export system protein LptA